MDTGAKIFIGALILSLLFQDSGWIIAFALLDIGDAIRKKGEVE